jgi:predicted short-subunit dehydrogenase-like oxidoreductase (DUF2520 family)
MTGRLDQISAHDLETALHNALSAGDIEAVEVFLRALLRVDPRRAIKVYDELKDPLTVVRVLGLSEEEEG